MIDIDSERNSVYEERIIKEKSNSVGKSSSEVSYRDKSLLEFSEITGQKSMKNSNLPRNSEKQFFDSLKTFKNLDSQLFLKNYNGKQSIRCIDGSESSQQNSQIFEDSPVIYPYESHSICLDSFNTLRNVESPIVSANNSKNLSLIMKKTQFYKSTAYQNNKELGDSQPISIESDEQQDIE